MCVGLWSVSAITTRPRTTTIQCPPVVVPADALIDPSDCSTVPQPVGVTCTLRCVQTVDHVVMMTCLASRQWTAVPNVLQCHNDTIMTTGMESA